MMDEITPAHDAPHHPGKQEVELYIRTYNTLLRSSGGVKLKTLAQSHCGMQSSLHADAMKKTPDMSAFIYAVNRLPACIMQTRRVLLGQSAWTFANEGIDVESWQKVGAPGRRRHWYYDGHETVAAYIASSSDLDDLIPTLVAYQIEWNKFHDLFQTDRTACTLVDQLPDPSAPNFAALSQQLRERCHVTPDDWARLSALWEESLGETMRTLAAAEKSFVVRMLGGTYVGYARATKKWWQPIGEALRARGLKSAPIYFISSNTHSLVNLVSGVARRHQDELTDFVARNEDPELTPELAKFQAGKSNASWENFLYYAAKQLASRHPEARLVKQRVSEETERGITFIPSWQALEVDAQIIELARLRPEDLDPRLGPVDVEALRQSNAVVLNIDYPLGLCAYHLLVEVAANVSSLLGVYIVGKAATLNGSIGDVMICDAVYDEHSQNTYWINNAFSAQDLGPYLVYGSVLDNQRAVATKGTFLQNRHYLDFYYQEQYTVLEMEAGPYLSACYEIAHPVRHPVGEDVHLTRLPFDLGLLHYASDTPYTRARTLGARKLSYYGMDSTYASTVAIWRRILKRESSRQFACGDGRASHS
jgi:hypothetical protein